MSRGACALSALLLCVLGPTVLAVEPLTDTPGDAARGRAVVLDRERGHCLLCHRIAQLDEGFQGNIGPPLSAIGARLRPSQIRRRLIDPTRLNPDTVMPAYYRVDDLRQVADAYRGRTILTAQEVEDVVAYVATLTTEADAPARESPVNAGTPPPPEVGALMPRSGYAYQSADIRALQDDDFANPAMLWVDRGAELWGEEPVSGKPACRGCHDEPASLRGVAVRYPQYSASDDGLIDLGTRINRCRTQQQAMPALGDESEPLLALTALVAHQSRGLAFDVATDGPARPYFEAGREYFYTRRGQMNLACYHCHEVNAGRFLRGDRLSQGQATGYPIYRLDWQTLGSLQRRLRFCNTGVRAEPLDFGDPSYLALELFLAWRARGLTSEAPAVRR